MLIFGLWTGLKPLSKVLTLICVMTACLAKSTTGDLSPKQVVEQFCAMDADGKQLTTEGWSRMAELLVRPTAAQKAPIFVAEDFAVSSASVHGDFADLFVEYIVLGQIDSEFRFKSLAPNPVKVRVNYRLARSVDASGATAAKWRIEPPLQPPYVSVSAAIRYLSQLRETEGITTNRENVDATISTLKRKQKRSASHR